MLKTKSLKTNEFKYTVWDRIIGIKLFSVLHIWFYKIVKILQWIPVLWEDEDWDYSYILKILEYKLSRVQKILKEDSFHLDKKTGKISGPILAKEVQEARNCIKRILEDDYCKKEQKQHNKKYGKLKIKFIKEKNIDGTIGNKIVFLPDSTPARESRIRIYKLADKRYKEDVKKLYKILEEKSFDWWT